ncbi:MAG: betaine-aldehyde dehydrogenase [Actinomycetota bacterium]|nr:betaine-aldehyde dehydrogenase [Actinomycetota bacterium]
MRERDIILFDIFVNCQWLGAEAGGSREIRCPADGTLVATVSEGTRPDAVKAIHAARDAFDRGDWPATPELERGALLLRAADLMVRDKAGLALAESLDTGKRLTEAEYDIDEVVNCFRYYGGIAGTDAGRVIDTGRSDAISRVVHEPVGVCALITPWNYPLMQTSWKVAPALLAGNTFVLKPSELTPSTAILLMHVLEEAGLPPGVANLVLGAGAEVGAVLSEHPDVDLVSFTGGLETGRHVMAAASQTVKKVALELGGKNPNIIFADADFETAVDFALTAVFLHSGQVCSAGARLLVQDELHDRFVDEVVRRAMRIRLGGPFEEKTETGTLISEAHLEKVASYVKSGIAEGAVLRCGGARAEDGPLAEGFFYLPTVLDECHTGMRVVQVESFGPVMTVERFTDEDDAVRIANDTNYGLAGAVWTQDGGKAQRVAGRLRHGTVWINDYHPYMPQAEWGGFKQSGIGRELGQAGLAEYRETKHIWQNIRPEAQRWFKG